MLDFARSNPRNQHDGSPSSPAAQILTRSRPDPKPDVFDARSDPDYQLPTRSVLQVACCPLVSSCSTPAAETIGRPSPATQPSLASASSACYSIWSSSRSTTCSTGHATPRAAASSEPRSPPHPRTPSTDLAAVAAVRKAATPSGRSARPLVTSGEPRCWRAPSQARRATRPHSPTQRQHAPCPRSTVSATRTWPRWFRLALYM